MATKPTAASPSVAPLDEWTFGPLDQDDNRSVRFADGHECASVRPDRETTWEAAQSKRDANARLIVAAPKLLAMLGKLRLSLREWQLQYDPDRSDTVTANALDECDALVRQIKGRL